MPPETLPFDAAEVLSPAGLDDLLDDAFASGEAAYIAVALGVVARARGMARVAEAAGVRREALYKSLSEDGNPTLKTVLGVTSALGYRLKVEPIPPR